ncbi:MAG: DHA1 family inner membrane transport protein [Ascidiaceihabitans sp.]|jgi:DHA1 family inner membrane transport protein
MGFGPKNMTKTPVGLILLLWGAGLGAAAQYAKVSVIFDQLPDVYPEAGAALGFAVSLVGFIGIVFGVVAGLLVARIRYRRALLWALWLGAAVSAIQSFLPSFEWFLVLRGIEGLSHLAMVVAAPTLIAQLSAPQHRGLTLTLWGTFFGVAFAVLAWGGLPLVAAYGVSALFAAHAVYMAVFAVILTFSLQALPSTETFPNLSIASILRDHIAIYRSPRISAAGLGWLFYTFCFVSVLTVMPPFLDPSERAFVTGAMPLASIISSMTIGVWALRYISAVGVVIWGFGCSIISMVWLGFDPENAYGCIALAASLGLVQGASFAAVPQLNDTAETQAQANGAMAQMGNVGNTIGTPIMVAALAGFGYIALPVFVSIALLMGLLIHLILRMLRNRA